MSLLDEYSEDFVLMEKTRIPDGEGGGITTWTEGMALRMAQRHDSTIQAQIAEKEDTASTYTFFVDKAMKLEAGDVVKRVSDGETFKITQNSAEDITPRSSALNLTMVTAKRWELTT